MSYKGTVASPAEYADLPNAPDVSNERSMISVINTTFDHTVLFSADLCVI